MTRLENGERSPNPLAPPWLFDPYLTGPDTPAGHHDEYHEYNITISLTAGQISNNNVLEMDADSCFVWRCIGIATDGAGGAGYIRIRDHRGTYMQQQPVLVDSFAFQGARQAPILPVLIVPASGRLLIDALEAGGASPVAINLCFVGVKRYKNEGWGSGAGGRGGIWGPGTPSGPGTTPNLGPQNGSGSRNGSNDGAAGPGSVVNRGSPGVGPAGGAL